MWNKACILNGFNETFTLAENPIYGSKRVGDFYQNLPLSEITFTVTGHNADSTVTMSGVANVTLTPPGPFPISPTQPPIYTRTLGNKSYELDDHLGNVLMTVSDRKIPNGTVGGSVTFFNADVLSGNDYYPFGQLISARRSIYGNYRFAYNGKEKEDEIYSPTNAYNYGMRMYDSRLGRFMSVDPLIRSYSYLTPYQFASNTPIWAIDVDGLEKVIYLINFDGYRASHAEINLENAGPLGDGVAVHFTDRNGKQYNFYGTELNDNATPEKFAESYEGGMDNDGNYRSYYVQVYNPVTKKMEDAGNLTGGHGHELNDEEKKEYPKGHVIPSSVVELWFTNDYNLRESTVLDNLNIDVSTPMKYGLVDITFNAGGVTDNFNKIGGDVGSDFFFHYLRDAKEHPGILPRRLGESFMSEYQEYIHFDYVHDQQSNAILNNEINTYNGTRYNDDGSESGPLS